MQESINSQSMLKVGTILRGIYRIDSYLSSGGFGNTYVATNVEFEERVAIKEFFMKGVTQRDDNQTTVSVSNTDNHNSFLEQREKFKKEARRIRQLNNPHIVRVHDLFEENGTAYYVMDYVDGENLSDRLKRTGKPMTEDEVNQILPQILDALKSIHDAGIWHLDLKPANIMIDKSGNVKLIDFGASKQLNTQKGGATTSTAISYTNGYAPREQMEQNYDKFGPWTDIYALGATLYNLLTNKRPPLPTDIDDDMSEDKHIALPFPDSTSTGMKQLVLQLMETNRVQRPQSIPDIPILSSWNASKYSVVNEKTKIVTTPNIQTSEETIIETKKKNVRVINEEESDEVVPPYLKQINGKGGKGNGKTGLKYISYIVLFLIGVILLVLLFTHHGVPNDNQKAENDSIIAEDLFLKGWNLLEMEDDSVKAFEYFKQAAELGSKNSYFFMGLYYLDGIVVKQDLVKALDYFTKSAKVGNGIAAYYAGLIYYRGCQTDSRLEKEINKAIEYLEIAANNNDSPDVFYQLGRCYLDKASFQNAFRNFEKAAHKDHPEAQHYLYFCYCHGVGTEENQKLAQMWRKRAIENGYKEEK